MADSKQFNLKNPAVKRILQEVKEMQRDASNEFLSMPIEEDLFEWQFAIHGPSETEFEGGIYHGRIILPSEYPFKPPAFMLLTPSGRFQVQTKICLSISQHHPEHWQPSWSVRTALVALIAFMPTKPDGAIGSLDYTSQERRLLAIKSRSSPPKFGSPERQKIINEIHERMLANAPPVPDTCPKPNGVEPIPKPTSQPDTEINSTPIKVSKVYLQNDSSSKPNSCHIHGTNTDDRKLKDNDLSNPNFQSGTDANSKTTDYHKDSEDSNISQILSSSSLNPQSLSSLSPHSNQSSFQENSNIANDVCPGKEEITGNEILDEQNGLPNASSSHLRHRNKTIHKHDKDVPTASSLSCANFQQPKSQSLAGDKIFNFLIYVILFAIFILVSRKLAITYLSGVSRR